MRVRVQSDAGVQQYGLLTFGYDRSNQHLEIEYVRVRKPDGKVISTPAEKFQDMTSEISRLAPMYSDYREKHVPVQGLEPGDLLEYKFQVKTQTPLIRGQFWFAYNFFTTDIVLDEELQVNVPKEREVVVHSAVIKPAIEDAGNRRTYTWKTANLKHHSPKEVEPGHLPPPSVEITTFKNWSEVGRWWGNLERQEAKPTPAIRAKAEELTQDAKTDAGKLRAIYKYVAEQFRYISISFGVGRYRPHAAGEVLQNGYGDCKDKHTLLAALLQAVGLKAYPALINSINEIDSEVPSPGQFDHVVSVVPLGQKQVWLDTTTEVAPLGLLMSNLRDKQALLIPGNQPAYLAKTPANPPFHSRLTFQVNGKLDKQGTLQAKIQRTARGDTEVLWRLVFRNVAQNHWEKVAQSFSTLLGFGGTVSNVTASDPDDIDNPFDYAYDYTRKGFSDWSNKRIQPALPGFGVPELKETGKKPSHPVFLQPQEYLYTSKIELPRGYTPQLPKAVNVKFDFAEYHSTYTLKNGVLIARRDLTINIPEVPVSRHKDYLTLQRAVSGDEGQYITLNQRQVSAAQPSINPEAVKLLNQSRQAIQMQDSSGAEDLLQRATKIDPHFERAWAVLAWLQYSHGENDEAAAACRKAIALNPKDPNPYRIMATVQMRLGRTQEAIQTMRDLLKEVPNQSDVEADLGSILVAQKDYREAVQLLEGAAKGNPTSPVLQFSLARAYAGTGDAEKAADAFKKAADLHPSRHVWETAAEALAKFQQTLPAAQHFAETAIKADEDTTSKLRIDGAGGSDLNLMGNLASDWGTLGWIFAREGNLASAQKYLEAAWNLSQGSTIGKHLGQVYERMGKKPAAIRMYACAISLSELPSPSEPRTRLRHLLGSKEKVNAAVDAAWREISQEQKVKLGRITKVMGSAEFYVLFSPGPKVDGVKFVSGKRQLQPLSKTITSARFHILFPDSNPVKLLHRGVMICPGSPFSCEFRLFAVTSKDQSSSH